MLEKDIERRMVRAFHERGALAWKFSSPGRQGVPDRIVLMPCGRVAFIELKTERGTLSPIQRNTIDRMRELGQDVRVVYGAQQAMQVVEELMGGGDIK